MSPFTAVAQLELRSVTTENLQRTFSPVMEHYAAPASYNMMKMPTHFQFIFHLGKQGYGCEEQLSSPVAMQQWQDGPNCILRGC